LVQDAILQLVEVTQELNQHWWCRVECRQTEDKRIVVEDLLGQDLQIVTRDQAGAEHVVFDGFVLESSLLYEVFGSYTARLKAVTRSYKLDLSAQEAYYRKGSLSDVAKALTASDGLSADVLAKDGAKRNYVQWGEPDFGFLVRIADDHRAWIRPTAQGIQICDAFQRGAKVTWRQEDGLLSFDVEGGLTPSAFDGTHSDARQMRSVTHLAVTKAAEHFGSSGPMVAAAEKQSKAKIPSGSAFLDGRAATADEYKVLLERESLRAAGSRVVGHGVSQKEDLKAGDTVEIAGVLDGKGMYGLTKVIHRWTAKGYENEFWCTPWKNYVAPRLPEPPEIPGVLTARVVDHNDPRKMGRIQVQYDWQEGGPTGWVRTTTPHAGQDRGFLFMPEIGDEVVVAFEHGDPERPYVVGYLWNGVDPAPRTEFWGEDVDPNDVKRIVTKSGHRIQFVDKPGKESIVIATPQHLKISLIEKTDETGRSMILLHSDGDIFINAPGGRVHFRGNQVSAETGGSGSNTSPVAGGAKKPAPTKQPAVFPTGITVPPPSIGKSNYGVNISDTTVVSPQGQTATAASTKRRLLATTAANVTAVDKVKWAKAVGRESQIPMSNVTFTEPMEKAAHLPKVTAPFDPGTNKCNQFVGEMLNAANIPVPVKYADGVAPIQANDWTPEKGPGKGWKQIKIPQKAQPGDVVALRRKKKSGHVGIITAEGEAVSAGEFGVHTERQGDRDSPPLFFNPEKKDDIFVWRYVGEEG
ncbi:MAG: type VI secretion system tip protein VgrG, partial [Candidatus Solibacter sp.]